MERELPDSVLQSLFRDLGFVSSSPELVPLLKRAYKAAEISDVTVLIEGETGTGKQVLAQAPCTSAWESGVCGVVLSLLVDRA